MGGGHTVQEQGRPVRGLGVTSEPSTRGHSRAGGEGRRVLGIVQVGF